MDNVDICQNRLAARTRFALIAVRLLGAPCWTLLSLLAFILYKQADLTASQMTWIIALKPTSSLLSPYWSQAIYRRSDRVFANLLGANCLRYLPFLFVPWIHSSWFVIFAFGWYMTLTRATIPAWMEICKQNLPRLQREQFIGLTTTIDYLGAALCAVGLGILLDLYDSSWRWLILIAAVSGVFSTWLLFLVRPVVAVECLAKPQVEVFQFVSYIREKILYPWKQVWQLMQQRRDFAVFQMGFMFCGAGLMIMQPALPQFFIDTLELSFVEMGCAISLCKGVGVSLTSSLWARLFRKVNIFQLSALVTFFACLFPFFLLAASSHVALLYLAYIFYGVMQGGSEMSWHMSSLVFAHEKDSSMFSITNVLTVGLRGCVVPVLGSCLLPWINPLGVMLMGALICLVASCTFFFSGRHVMANRLLA
jgi:predicted MFS family arabinose efflux permease